MINVAIIGTGGISMRIFRGYLQFPDRCQIVALVDIVPGKAAQVKVKVPSDPGGGIRKS